MPKPFGLLSSLKRDMEPNKRQGWQHPSRHITFPIFSVTYDVICFDRIKTCVCELPSGYLLHSHWKSARYSSIIDLFRSVIPHVQNCNTNYQRVALVISCRILIISTINLCLLVKPRLWVKPMKSHEIHVKSHWILSYPVKWLVKSHETMISLDIDRILLNGLVTCL
jgi:hypothetical protein